MSSWDAIVIGAGVIGTSVAYNLAALGAQRVLVLERDQIGAGTTSQSSGILRTHYSVVENMALAQQSWSVFENFAAHLQDEDASAGLVRCGYLIASPEGPKLAPLREALAAQEAGMQVLGYTTQAHFLINCGLLSKMELLAQAERATAAKLIMEHEMGELFKVLALGAGDAWEPVGFARGDRSHRL